MKYDNPSEIMSKNSALWHKSCRLKYSKTKAEKLTSANIEIPSSSSSSNQASNTRSSRSTTVNTSDTTNLKCFFCNIADEDLHQVTTLNTDRKIRAAAEYLNDHDLLAKLSQGDLIALAARYHLKCLIHLCN